MNQTSEMLRRWEYRSRFHQSIRLKFVDSTATLRVSSKVYILNESFDFLITLVKDVSNSHKLKRMAHAFCIYFRIRKPTKESRYNNKHDGVKCTSAHHENEIKPPQPFTLRIGPLQIAQRFLFCIWRAKLNLQ